MPSYSIKANRRQSKQKTGFKAKISKVQQLPISPEGLRINVEWSKKSGRYDENRRKRHED
jgi:hypothetical protein